MSGVWQELKSRKIFKAATIYAAVAWGVIQIADVLLPVLGVQNWVMSSMVLLAFSGFPVALILGWMLDIRLERKKSANNSGKELPRRSTLARFAEFGVISLFGVGAAVLYYNSASEPVQANTQQIEDIARLLKPVAEQKAIAVLPFASYSDNTQDEFFADGLSEELLNVLARNKKLRVAARTSSFQYKNTKVNIRTIAEELGVEYILEGSVRRSGDVIRVSAQLVKADEETYVFSNSWDRNISDVFEVQDEISQSVLDELKISLLGESESIDKEIGTKNIAAFAEYSRGLAFLRNRGKSDFEQAIESFNKVIALDNNYAEAFAMLAEAYLLQYSYGFVDFDKAEESAKGLVEKALILNPELAAAHAVKGLMHWQKASRNDAARAQLQLAKQHLTKAIDINPSIAEAYMWYGSILQQEGNFTTGVALRKKAFEIDPQAAVVGFNRASDLVRFGNYEQAMDVFNTVVRNNPNYPAAYGIAGDVSFAVGQLDQAYNMYNRSAELAGDSTMWLVNSSRIYIPIGQYQLAQSNVDLLRKQSPKGHSDKFNWMQAAIWLASNELNRFYQWTEGFEEETQNWEERFWRGLSAMQQNKPKLAEADLEQALGILRENNAKKVDENTIRVELLMARNYQSIGNQLAANNHLTAVAVGIEQLKSQGFDSQRIRYQQAALEALKGDSHRALSLLRQSVQEGFVDFWWIETDPSFDAVRKEPIYTAIRDEFEIRMKLMQNNIENQFGKLALGA